MMRYDKIQQVTDDTWFARQAPPKFLCRGCGYTPNGAPMPIGPPRPSSEWILPFARAASVL